MGRHDSTNSWPWCVQIYNKTASSPQIRNQHGLKGLHTFYFILFYFLVPRTKISMFFFWFFTIFSITGLTVTKRVQERSSNHVARCSPLLQFQIHLPVLQQYWIDQAILPKYINENKKLCSLLCIVVFAPSYNAIQIPKIKAHSKRIWD